MSEPLKDDLLEHFGGRDTGLPRDGEPSFIRAKSPPVRLDIRTLDGNRRSIPYSQVSYIHFNGTDITVSLGEWELVLKGLNLKPLYEALNRHTVSAIIQLEPLFSVDPLARTSVVETIELKVAALNDTMQVTERMR